jgi:hypothetical protein
VGLGHTATFVTVFIMPTRTTCGGQQSHGNSGKGSQRTQRTQHTQRFEIADALVHYLLFSTWPWCHLHYSVTGLHVHAEAATKLVTSFSPVSCWCHGARRHPHPPATVLGLEAWPTLDGYGDLCHESTALPAGWRGGGGGGLVG